MASFGQGVATPMHTNTPEKLNNVRQLNARCDAFSHEKVMKRHNSFPCNGDFT